MTYRIDETIDVLDDEDGSGVSIRMSPTGLVVITQLDSRDETSIVVSAVALPLMIKVLQRFERK